MSESVVRPREQVFTTYVGLTAAGYDMACQSSRLVALIRDMSWPTDVVTYFREARMDGCLVNPYWPRSFLLTLASLYLPNSPPYRYADPEIIVRHIQGLDSISPGHKGKETVRWILRLPVVYGLLRMEPVLDRLSKMYEASIDFARCEQVLSTAVSLVAERIGITPQALPNLIIVPNPLQAPEQTDFVELDGSTCLITAEPDVSSCIHELLHRILTPIIELSRPKIDKSVHLLGPILGDMLRLAYAWDESAQSWQRVFEEQFIRAAETWVSCGDGSESSERAAMHADMGFRYVPAIVRQFQTSFSGMGTMEAFIADCLQTLGS